ncbi:peritrophin-1 [Drosophila ficusphila]|uniref:peritrophin-1 n=1 Tax=Drosophila ficusphila TaxID=30025 RepID=UPI0007E70307|nr:peritrophin-1 [Drosophila ficusphila]
MQPIGSLLANNFSRTFSLCVLYIGLCVAQVVIRESFPNDCSRFYETRELKCPPEFHWNSQRQQCDLKSVAGCSSTLTIPNWNDVEGINPISNQKLEPEKQNLSGVCNKQLGQLIAYPGDCTRFIQCDYLPFVKTCPQYLYWNSQLLTCDKICV